MRRLYLAACVALLVSAAPVFSQAYEHTIDYDKKKQKAAAIDCNYPQEAVENAIIDKLKAMGNSPKEEKGIFNRDKGFIVFQNAYVREINDKSMDYIIKIDRKSRKEKDATTLYLIVSKDGENVLADDVHSLERAKVFLNELNPQFESSHLEIKIKSQEDVVVKAEKKFKDLQDEQESLEKKIKGLQDDLKNNAKAQEEQQKLIENQRQALGEMKGKRKV